MQEGGRFGEKSRFISLPVPLWLGYQLAEVCNWKKKGNFKMALPTFTMRQLMEAGVHFGHNARRWNPKMQEYIFGERDKVHILDLGKTVPALYRAMQAVRDVAAAGGKVLFVGTKKQASERIAEAAGKCGQYYVNYRWLGGTLTNWSTVSQSIKTLKDIDSKEEKGENDGLTKKERLNLARTKEKLVRGLGGIKNMGGVPDIVFIVDVQKEMLAIKEARKLGIPVVAICDTNADPDLVDYVIPGNDDASRAIALYCDLMSGAVLDGIKAELTAAGVDVAKAQTAEETE